MAQSNPKTIEIREQTVLDGRRSLKALELYIDGARLAAVEQQLNEKLKFRFYAAGAFDYQEARVWLQGLMELFVVAEALDHGKKTTK